MLYFVFYIDFSIFFFRRFYTLQYTSFIKSIDSIRSDPDFKTKTCKTDTRPNELERLGIEGVDILPLIKEMF